MASRYDKRLDKAIKYLEAAWKALPWKTDPIYTEVPYLKTVRESVVGALHDARNISLLESWNEENTRELFALRERLNGHRLKPRADGTYPEKADD